MDRRTLFAAMGAAMAGAGVAEAKLADKVLGTSDVDVIPESYGEARIYFDGPTDQLKVMTAGSVTLKPGASPHPPHKHPEEEFMLVSDGECEISVDGEITKCGLGSLMYCAADKLHGIENTSTKPMTFFFFKWAKD